VASLWKAQSVARCRFAFHPVRPESNDSGSSAVSKLVKIFEIYENEEQSVAP